MSVELPKSYDPSSFEDRIYKFWLEKGFFNSDPDESRKKFSIVIPPPNVTSVLHMGHGLNNTIQDALVRYKRMKGFNTLWVPGTDHAGIATQNVVERKLAKKGKTRFDLGREKFVEEVWKWKEEHGSRIIEQLKKIGASCDWRRERFTMDEGLSKAVRECFVQLYEAGLIYRGDYIINWCPRCGTALADDEVEHEEKEGKLWYIKYPMKDGNDYVIVATTRPETMLGDTAVAVNPNDERYKDLIGKTVILPLANREIPVIADDYVDPEFGTGIVKITPGHDPNDFEIGKRHNLPLINILNPDATLNDNVPEPYRGLDRFEARKKVVEDLEKQGLIEKVEKHIHSVGHCYRCHTVIEPYVSTQWFVKMKPLAEKAIQVAEEGKVRFFPENWKKVYLHWLNNVRDWCISRQIWWGHQIPAWYCDDCGKVTVSREDPEKCQHCGSKNIRRDTDVLDTWFSSWLWPFSTLGWPNETEDLKYYYPTDALVTAPDILFFWVARMIMAGLFFMGKEPFRDVILHGRVLDEFGRKMSKSLGNGIDPIEVVKQYGADALRYTILAIAPLGNDLLLSMDKFKIGSRFANKIWNATRFILMNIDENIEIPEVESVWNEMSLIDRWIVSLYNSTVEEITDHYERYQFDSVAKKLHEFIWGNFCDWYLELSKVDLQKGDEKTKRKTTAVLLYVLEGSLRLLHPIMPFITEELWQKLPNKKGESIMIAEWPSQNPKLIDKTAEEKVKVLQEVVSAVRNIKGEMGIQPSARVNLNLKPKEKWVEEVVKEYIEYVMKLGGIESVSINSEYQKGKYDAVGIGKYTDIFVPLEGLIDFEKERAKARKELKKIEFELGKTKNRLSNDKFVNNAPPEVVERERRKEKEFEEKIAKLKKLLEVIGE